MDAPVPRSWEELSGEPLTIEAIRKLHAPASRYVIRPNSYKPGAAFLGRGKALRMYILGGACARSVDGVRIELHAGMFADFQDGEYEFEVLGAREVNLVNVWRNPEPAD